MKYIHIISISLLLGGCLERQAAAQLHEIENQVALDAEKQYKIAKEHGDPMDAYTQASLVAAAYLQAEDSVNYKKWKEIEKQEAKIVGLD